MRRQVILILALVGALLAVPAVAQAHPALEPRIAALESAVANLQSRVGFLESRGTYHKVQTYFVPPGAGSATLLCNSGDLATGGGWRDHDEGTRLDIEWDAPNLTGSGKPDGWMVVTRNNDTVQLKVDVFVVCLDQP